MLLIVCFLAGIAIRWTGRVSADSHKALSAVIVNISLPATALTYLHQLHWGSGVVYAILMPWAMFLLAACVFVTVGYYTNLAKESIGALILLCGLGNTSFVGLPLVEALYGKDALPVATAIDQAGTYLVLSTLGLVIAAYCGIGTTSAKAVLVRVSTYPPFIAMIAAILLIPVAYPKPIDITLHRLSDTLAPLALLSVGIQMSIRDVSAMKVPLVAGLLFKLVACPCLVLLAYLASGEQLGMDAHVVVLESAMGPAIGAGIIANQHELNPKLVTLLICIGIPVSFISAPLVGAAMSSGWF